MKILLTGGSGFLGRNIREKLIEEGHCVISVCRSQGVNFNLMTEERDWLPFLHDVDVVINAVGIIVETCSQSFDTIHTRTPIALFQACVKAGIKRVIQISALGAEQESVMPYLRSKYTADEALRQLPLDWFILRPSLIYGVEGKSTKFFNQLAKFPVLPLIDAGSQQIQPIHVDDVIATVLSCLVAMPANRTLDLVGPQSMSFREWITRLRKQQGKPPARVMSLPYELVHPMACVTKYFLPLTHPDNLRMLQQGSVANVQPIADFLGRMPRVVP